MLVPSIVCPGDFNLLLNRTMSSVWVINAEPFTVDPRLFGQAAR